MKKVAFFLALITAYIVAPSVGYAHTDINAPTITLDEFWKNLTFDKDKKRWLRNINGGSTHVRLEVGYTAGILLNRFERGHQFRATILLAPPLQEDRNRTIPKSDGGVIKIDRTGLYLRLANDRMTHKALVRELDRYFPFLNPEKPITVIAHPTQWGWSRYLNDPNHFYYLAIYFDEIVEPPPVPCIECWDEVKVQNDSNNDLNADRNQIVVKWYRDPDHAGREDSLAGWGMVIFRKMWNGTLEPFMRAWDIYRGEKGFEWHNIRVALLLDNDTWFVGDAGERLKVHREYDSCKLTTSIRYTFDGKHQDTGKTVELESDYSCRTSIETP